MNTEALDRAAIVEAVTQEVMKRLEAASAHEASTCAAAAKQAVIKRLRCAHYSKSVHSALS